MRLDGGSVDARAERQSISYRFLWSSCQDALKQSIGKDLRVVPISARGRRQAPALRNGALAGTLGTEDPE